MSFVTKILLASLFVITTIHCYPGGGYHHIHHRIHVPQKIKTIYHTKIIKVPEHHHHFHEKEKIIIEKEEPKEVHHHPVILKDEEHHSWLKGEEHHGWSPVDESNSLKKKRNVQHGKKHKKRRTVSSSQNHHPYPYDKEYQD